jgi:hypothetical protein
MENCIKDYKWLKNTLRKINENVERDREIHNVDREVKELGEKFDYYMFQMIKQKKVKVPTLNKDFYHEETIYVEDDDYEDSEEELSEAKT